MSKFFVKNNQINNNIVIIVGQDVNHIANVLRLKIEDEIEICDSDKGESYKCKITQIEKDEIECKILEKLSRDQEENIEITIFQGLPKADKMELIIQKCTELGVSQITPVQMDRSIVKFDSKSELRKIERWQKIAEAASKQCRRNSICKINNITNIKKICNNIKNYDILLVPYENEKDISLKIVLDDIKKDCIKNKKQIKIAIVIGPEGGYDKEEIELLENAGGRIITLGNRILRTETVAIAMSSIIMYEFGNLE